jgi:DNA-binding response OmpR family regulator
MSLAPGERSTEDDLGLGVDAEVPTVVIAIATSSKDRVRIASLMTGSALLLVASREEALLVLAGSTPPPEVPAPRVSSDESPRVLREEDSRATLEVDSDLRVARWGAETVHLSPLEHDLLVRLLSQLGRTCTFESLHRAVWGNDFLRGRDNVWSVVKRLRRKLIALGCPLRISAVRGVGLRLADVDAGPGR